MKKVGQALSLSTVGSIQGWQAEAPVPRDTQRPALVPQNGSALQQQSLFARTRDGDLRGGHTKDHTMLKAPIESGLSGNPALLDVTAVGIADIERGGRCGADPNARDLQGRLGRARGTSAGCQLREFAFLHLGYTACARCTSLRTRFGAVSEWTIRPGPHRWLCGV